MLVPPQARLPRFHDCMIPVHVGFFGEGHGAGSGTLDIASVSHAIPPNNEVSAFGLLPSEDALAT